MFCQCFNFNIYIRKNNSIDISKSIIKIIFTFIAPKLIN